MIQTFHYIRVFTRQRITNVVDGVYLCSIALLRLANSSYLSVHRAWQGWGAVGNKCANYFRG